MIGFRFGNPFGFCGGMVLGTLWMLKHNLICTATKVPTITSKLFWRLLCWQVRSLLPFGFVKVYLHQCGILPPEKVRINGPTRIMLVWRRSWNPFWLTEAHQVLAYRQDGGILYIYDPNWPGDDSVRITGHSHSHDGSIHRMYCCDGRV